MIIFRFKLTLENVLFIYTTFFKSVTIYSIFFLKICKFTCFFLIDYIHYNYKKHPHYMSFYNIWHTRSRLSQANHAVSTVRPKLIHKDVSIKDTPDISYQPGSEEDGKVSGYIVPSGAPFWLKKLEKFIAFEFISMLFSLVIKILYAYHELDYLEKQMLLLIEQ